MTLGVREGVIALILLVALYIVFVLLRMRHLRQKRASVPAMQTALEEPPEDIPVLTQPDNSPDETSGPAVPIDQAWEKAADGMADQMLRRSLEQEIEQLRDEVDAMRGELAALRQDMLDELSHLRASQSVSPIYGDAMQMAIAGYDPVMISERCGIARAEAELVVSLAKSQGS